MPLNIFTVITFQPWKQAASLPLMTTQLTRGNLIALPVAITFYSQYMTTDCDCWQSVQAREGMHCWQEFWGCHVYQVQWLVAVKCDIVTLVLSLDIRNILLSDNKFLSLLEMIVIYCSRDIPQSLLQPNETN